MVHKAKKWTPSQFDIEWTKDLVRKLKIGGTWGTSFATFRKNSEFEFELLKINPDPRENALENIDKVEKTFKAIGIKLKREKYDFIIASLIPKQKFIIGFKKKK